MPEVAEEKQGQQPPAPPASAPVPRRVFERLMRLVMGLGAFCWGFSLAFLLSQWGILGDLGKRSVVWGRLELSPLGIGVGAAVAILALVVCLKKLGHRLDWYKPHQATAVRAVAFACIGALTFYGSYAFYQIPTTTSVWWVDLWKAEVFGKTFALKPILFPAAGVFLGVMATAYFLLNQPRWGEFLIETEGELKKVSWPPRKEYVGSAVVVVVVVAVISFFLWGADTVLSRVMQWWGIGF